VSNDLSLAQSEIEVLNQRIQLFEDEVAGLYQDQKDSKAKKNSQNIKIMTNDELREDLEAKKKFLEEDIN
jgi:hypothetical protein